MFYPGMKIYIDPRGLSPGIGTHSPVKRASILGTVDTIQFSKSDHI